VAPWQLNCSAYPCDRPLAPGAQPLAGGAGSFIFERVPALFAGAVAFPASPLAPPALRAAFGQVGAPGRKPGRMTRQLSGGRLESEARSHERFAP